MDYVLPGVLEFG